MVRISDCVRVSHCNHASCDDCRLTLKAIIEAVPFLFFVPDDIPPRPRRGRTSSPGPVTALDCTAQSRGREAALTNFAKAAETTLRPATRLSVGNPTCFVANQRSLTAAAPSTLSKPLVCPRSPANLQPFPTTPRPGPAAIRPGRTSSPGPVTALDCTAQSRGREAALTNFAKAAETTLRPATRLSVGNPTCFVADQRSLTAAAPSTLSKPLVCPTMAYNRNIPAGIFSCFRPLVLFLSSVGPPVG